MTIRGTLETFNLCELLQMLAFNRKVGTLVLEAAAGCRTAYLTEGEVSFARRDPHINTSILRLARRHEIADAATLQLAVTRHEESGLDVGRVLLEMELIDEETLHAWLYEAAAEQLFEAQLTAVSSFEFMEGRVLRPDGEEDEPIQPAQAVEGLLLELARRLDQWNAVTDVVPSAREVFEGTGIAVSLADIEGIDPELAEAVIGRIDGQRSLAELAEETHTTLYDVTLIAGALYEAGGVRAVPTEDLIARAEDLIARAEPVAALPMLRRAIERGDAPIEVRLRLADALEASADPLAAAAELDTFAALNEEEDAVPIFEALTRALRLREGDVATAMRVCDFYLRRRPWLHEYQSQAVQALRDLVQGATQARRPLDAAHRLSGFIQSGDAPSEDLQLLSDLYLAAGQPTDAASALSRRAEDLIELDRTHEARELLRRAGDIDPSHPDVKRRIQDMRGVERRRLHKTRMVLLALLLIAVVGGGGFMYTKYRTSATQDVGAAEQEAVDALAAAEKEADGLIAAFEAHVKALETSPDEDPDLVARADAMRSEVRATMSACQRALSAYGLEIETYSASGDQERHRGKMRALDQRRHAMNSRASQVVSELTKRARRSMQNARTLNTQGQFREARKELLIARNLCLQDEEIHRLASQLLGHVLDYFESFESQRQAMEAATEAGDVRLAYETGVQVLRDLMDSDLTRELAFPVRVETTPPGAAVWISGTDTGLVTPCVATFSPFAEAPRLAVRMSGHTSLHVDLPTYEKIVRPAAGTRPFEPFVRATLVEGPRWAVSDPGGAFSSLWLSGKVPVVVGGKGHDVYAVNEEDGYMTLGERVDPVQPPIRLGGVMSGGIRWHVRGQLTVTVRAGSGKPWVQKLHGHIDRPPTLVKGIFVVVDEYGTIYGFDVRNGEFRWKHSLGETPSQAPMASAIGVLIATTSGSGFRVDPESGSLHRLGPSARGAALAVPFGDGALFLGGGRDGLRYVSADGQIETRGHAAPLTACAPWAGAAGVAWLERSGVRWLAAGTQEPQVLAGFGRSVTALGSDGTTLVAADAAGTLRGIPLEDPAGKQAWQVVLGGVPEAGPVVAGSSAYVVVAGRLVAVEI